MKKALTALSTAVGLAGFGLVAPTTTATATPPAPSASSNADLSSSFAPSPINWGACTNPRLKQSGAQCGFVEVPLDYAKPKGEKIKLAVSRIKAKTTADKRQGVMLVNPGGPGGSGLGLSRLGAYVPNHGGDPYDWIGFDPRGVGSSVPSLACDGNYFGYNRPDYRIPKAGTERQWLAKTSGYSKACAGAAGARLLPHLKSLDNVRDMDSIRKALGEKQINFYGFSYGTYLGQVYATVFPKQTRRMVMDGVVNAKDDWYHSNLNQDIAFDRNMDVYFDWIAKNDATYHLGTNGRLIKKKWYATLERAAANPVNGKIGPDEWTDAFLNAGYYVFGWEDDAAAMAAAINDDDFGPVTALYDAANGAGPGSDNGYAIYLGTQCTDEQWPTSWQKWKADNTRIAKKAPFETWANNAFNMPCLTWKAKASRPVTISGVNAPPVLLIAETLDGATPFAGALEMRKRFPKSVLIEGLGGTTHSGSLNGVACTDNKIADYLLTGKLPERSGGSNHSDVQCDPVPQPVPGVQNTLTGSASETGVKANAGKRKGQGMPADLRAELQQATSAYARR